MTNTLLEEIAEMKKYGYHGADMVPISTETGSLLLRYGKPIYELFPDDTEALVEDVGEICSDSCTMLGIERKAIKELWLEFGDVPMDPETECIDEPWMDFPKGTFREDIWHWFEDAFHLSVAEDLMHIG